MINWPFFPRPKPTPEPSPEPAPNDRDGVLWLKIGLLLRKIPVKRALAGLITVPVLLFFAVSGLIAWLVLVIKFVVGIYNVL